MQTLWCKQKKKKTTNKNKLTKTPKQKTKKQTKTNKKPEPKTYLFFRCWTLPRHLNLPLTIIAIRVHRASHSSMLQAEITSLVLQTALKGRAERLSLASSPGRCKSQGMAQVGCYLPVRCKHHWSPLLDNTQSTIPQEATCFGIHPCCWLILQKVCKEQIMLLHSNEKYLIFEMACPFLIMETLKTSK